jgi:hypothetical protein
MPASFIHSFIFPHLEKGLGPTGSPLPPMGLSFNSSQTLSLTIVLSVEETLMYFSYTCAPNLTHQGAFVITKISSANGYRNPTSPKTYYFIHGPKIHFQRAQTIQMVIKLACDQNIKEACARAPIENAGKAHIRSMLDCVRKKTCTPHNNATLADPTEIASVSLLLIQVTKMIQHSPLGIISLLCSPPLLIVNFAHVVTMPHEWGKSKQ